MFTSSDDGDAAASEQGASNNAASIETIPNSEIDRVINDLIRECVSNAQSK